MRKVTKDTSRRANLVMQRSTHSFHAMLPNISVKLLAVFILLVVLLTCLFTFPKFALAHEVVDVSGYTKGSIEISQVDTSGNIVEGGQVAAYKVASVSINGRSGDTNFVWLEDWGIAGEQVDAAALDDAEVASALAEIAQVQDAVPYATKIVGESGKACLDDLDVGLYLVVQTQAPARYSSFSPFLISVPFLNESGEPYVYDVDASPKMAPLVLLNFAEGDPSPDPALEPSPDSITSEPQNYVSQIPSNIKTVADAQIGLGITADQSYIVSLIALLGCVLSIFAMSRSSSKLSSKSSAKATSRASLSKSSSIPSTIKSSSSSKSSSLS
jgi:hypothetical protein